MTMANEMMQLAGGVAARKSQRANAVAAIRPALQQQLDASRSSRHAAVNALMASVKKDMALIKKDLDGIFSETAVIRGRSVDMMQAFANQRKSNATALRAELETYMSGLETAVANLLRDYSRARDEMGAREMDAREAFLKDLRIRVQMLLRNAEKSISDLAADRAKAGKAWREQLGAKDQPSPQAEVKTVAPEPAARETAAPKPVVETKPVAETKVAPQPAVETKVAAKPAAETTETPAVSAAKTVVAETAAPAPAAEAKPAAAKTVAAKPATASRSKARGGATQTAPKKTDR